MTKSEIREHLIRLGDEMVAWAWNEFAAAERLYDSQLVGMEYLDTFLEGKKPSEIAAMCTNDFFDPTEAFFLLDDSGCLCSLNLVDGDLFSEKADFLLGLDYMLDAIAGGEFWPSIFDTFPVSDEVGVAV